MQFSVGVMFIPKKIPNFKYMMRESGLAETESKRGVGVMVNKLKKILTQYGALVKKKTHFLQEIVKKKE